MKKTLLILCFILAFTSHVFAYQITAGAKTKRIPAGTKLELKMANSVSSGKVSVGDMFSAYLTRDVRTQTVMILPKGTVIRGNIVKIVEPKLLSRSGALFLNFDHVVAPNGSHIPVNAGLIGTFSLNDEGGIKGGGNYGAAVKENADKSGKIVKKAVNWGVTSGEDLFKGGKYLITPFSSVGGVFAGGGYFVGSSIGDLFHKGKSVEIPKGQVFNVVLTEPLDIPISE